MTNYKTGRIYKIIHNKSNIVYVGSTFNRLTDRFRTHKNDFERYLKGEIYGATIYPYFKEFGVDNFSIVLIKEYMTVDRKHLLSLEQLWINKLKPVNKYCSFQILHKQKAKEWRENNQEYIKDFMVEWRANNQDKIKEQKIKWRANNQDKIKEKEKEYREQNKERIKQRDKDKREKDKEIRNLKIICECGGSYVIRNRSIHYKTKKHMNYSSTIS